MTDLVTPPDSSAQPGAAHTGAAHPEVTADLVALNASLSSGVAAGLGAALDTAIEVGPTDRQGEVEELIPPGGSCGLIAAVGSPGVRQVVIVVDDATRASLVSAADAAGTSSGTAAGTAVGASGGTSDWLAPIGDALEKWVRDMSCTLEAALPVDSAAQLNELVPSASSVALVGAGLFVADQHIGTVALVGSSATNEPDGQSRERAEQDAGTADRPGTGPARPSPPMTSREAPGEPALSSSLQMLADVEMSVTAELGRARMHVAQLLALSSGSVIELDRSAGSPIDLLVNGTLIARGEVVVVDEDYGVRITEICGSDER